MDCDTENKINALASGFRAYSELLVAIGDQTRQYLVLQMMKTGDCRGIRVGDLAKKAHLSRPAVSHHLQVLKRAGIVQVRSEGTKNYYFFDIEPEIFDGAIELIHLASDIIGALPDSRNHA